MHTLVVSEQGGEAATVLLTVILTVYIVDWDSPIQVINLSMDVGFDLRQAFLNVGQVSILGVLLSYKCVIRRGLSPSVHINKLKERSKGLRHRRRDL